jgi:hypothetical protein
MTPQDVHTRLRPSNVRVLALCLIAFGLAGACGGRTIEAEPSGGEDPSRRDASSADAALFDVATDARADADGDADADASGTGRCRCDRRVERLARRGCLFRVSGGSGDFRCVVDVSEPTPVELDLFRNCIQEPPPSWTPRDDIDDNVIELCGCDPSRNYQLCAGR